MEIRNVHRFNIRQEFQNIRKILSPRRRTFLSVDTEFPGTVVTSLKPYYNLSNQERYDLMRDNVNKLNLIQLGLAVSDVSQGSKTVWEFNFKDFDMEKDQYNPKSIELLNKHGVDFARNLEEGIRGEDFAREFNELLKFAQMEHLNLTWVFFHCTYDLGYLLKILTQKPLPKRVDTFVEKVHSLLGSKVFDLKEMVKSDGFGWNCGLNKVAENLKVERIAGKSHQAGSDSLLTLDCFFAVFESIASEAKAAEMWKRFEFKLHGFDDIALPQLQRENVMCKKFDVQQNSCLGLQNNCELTLRYPLQNSSNLQNSSGLTVQYPSGLTTDPCYKFGMQNSNLMNSGLMMTMNPAPWLAAANVDFNVCSPHVNYMVKSR